jgi:hypothetical protein
METQINHRLFQSWRDPALYCSIVNYVETHPGVIIDTLSPKSWSNGRWYYSNLIFQSEEDYLVFRLRFK